MYTINILNYSFYKISIKSATILCFSIKFFLEEEFEILNMEC